VKQTQIGERMAKVEQKLDDLVEDIVEVKKTLDDFIKCADKRYAPAWVSWAMKLIIATSVTGGVGYIVWTIQKLVEKTL
jgi:nitrate reductase NapE component